MAGKFGVFNSSQKWKKGDLPGDPTVSVIVNEYTTSEEGKINISATLVTDSEIDFTIDTLQKNLESVRKEAKRILKLQKEKIRASFNEHG